MMSHLGAGLLALVLAAAPVTDDPDPRPFHLEVRGGIGTGEFHGSASGDRRSAGANWKVRAGFQPLEKLVLTLGYGQSSFGCRGGLCAQSPVTYSGSGFELEAATDWRALRFGVGLTRQSLGAEWTDIAGVRGTSESDPSIGWFAELSVNIPVTARFSVAPGVRYMRHGAEFGTGLSRPTVQLMGDVGVRYQLPVRR